MSRHTAPRRILRSAGLLLAALLLLGCVDLVRTSVAASADTLTVAQDAFRTGWDSTEPALTQAQVASSSFGRLFATPVTGQAYAQPLVVHGSVIAATETNDVYSLDGGTGAVRWHRTLGPSWDPATLSCGDLTPQIGITSTPVYDAATDAVYLTAKTDDGGSATTPNWYVHGLDATTGAERPGFPVRIGGAPSNDPTHPFDALTAAQRPGLLLLGGVVYAGFASHCDHGPFVGYVVGVSTGGAQTAMWSTESGNGSGEAGIWQSGAGLVSDGPGQILFATGNGISPQPAPGTSPPATLGESIVRLTVQPDGSLRPTDFFSPATNAKLDQDDADLGAGGPLAVPDGYGTAAHPHLLVHVGKDGKVYVLDRDHLGGMAQGAGGGDAIVSTSGPYNGLWGRPAFLGTSSGGYVYYAGNGGPLRALRLVPTSSGAVSVASAGTSAGTFPYSSGSPVVTSDGRDGSSALVWVVYSSGGTGANAELRAYRALPDSTGLLQQVFSAPIGTAAKFSSLATSDGRVYVGTRDGRVYGFGAPTTAAVGAAGTDLGSAPVGIAHAGTVTVTATRAVTLTKATATSPFSVGTMALPLTLATGASAAIPVTFTPGTAGQVSGSLSLVTSDGEAVALDVHGLGTRDGLGAAPAALQFADVPTGSASIQTVSITNTGTSAETITGLSAPTSPELTVDAAAVTPGQVLQPQQTAAVAVTYTPTSTAGPVDALTVVGSLGTVTVPIRATAVSGAPHLSMPSSLTFGDVPVGLTSTLTFPITNTGNIAMTITKAKAPQGVFTTSAPISEGLVIPPGDTAFQSVTFAPTAAGPVADAGMFYLITTDDGSGAHEVMLTGNGVDDPIAVLGARDGGSYSRPLGVVASAEYAAGDGRCQNYTSGVVCWSPTAGLHEVRGAIAAAYQAAGGPKGALGLPVTDQVAVGDAAGGASTDFAGANGPSIYWSPATGAHVVLGAIKAEWLAMGGARGQIGYPTTDELADADGVGRHNDFNGPAAPSIYWSPSTGAHFVWGAIRTEWVGRGAERGLGYPTTDEVCGLRDGGCAEHFSNSASIYFSVATGAHALTGAIRDKYAAQGWQDGRLAYPTVDQFGPLPAAGGYGQHFQGGEIYYTAATGAHPVWGAIRDEWTATGWENNLGYPTTDEVCGLRDGGCAQHFSNSASIYASGASGTHLVRGMIRAQWASLGWENGRLAYPVTDEVCGLRQGGCAEHFQGGSIYYTPPTGAHEVWGAIRSYWSSIGWENSVLGYPTSNEFRSGTSTRQNFQHGYLLVDSKGRVTRH